MTTWDAWAAVSAALFLGQVMTVCGLLVIGLKESALAHAQFSLDGSTAGLKPSPVTSSAQIWLLLAVVSTVGPALGDLLRHLGVYGLREWLAPLTDASLLLIGPALWFYARTVTWHAGQPLPSWRSFRLHALPAAAVFMLLAGAAFVVDETQSVAMTERSVDEVLSLIPVALQLLVYVGLILRRVHTARTEVLHWQSDLTHRRLRWLTVAAWLVACVVVVWMISWAWSAAISDLVTNLLMAGWLALVGVFGVRQSNLFSVRQSESRGVNAAPTDSDDLSGCIEREELGEEIGRIPPNDGRPTDTEGSKQHSGRYAKAALSSQQAQMLADRLERAMHDDKLYLDHELSLPALAQAIGATPHQLSQVLSTHVEKSFYDYVNAWRVQAVQATLARPGSVGRPLLEIALECGFGSKSAFNDVFKRVTGMSPSAYRKGLPATAAQAGSVQTHGEGRTG